MTGFKDRRVDQLLAVYDREFDQAKRVEIVRENDGILANTHHSILEWDAPFQRLAFWNEFGDPESYLTRYGDYTASPSVCGATFRGRRRSRTPAATTRRHAEPWAVA